MTAIRNADILRLVGSMPELADTGRASPTASLIPSVAFAYRIKSAPLDSSVCGLKIDELIAG
jgi:hypothetical protein